MLTLEAILVVTLPNNFDGWSPRAQDPTDSRVWTTSEASWPSPVRGRFLSQRFLPMIHGQCVKCFRWVTHWQKRKLHSVNLKSKFTYFISKWLYLGMAKRITIQDAHAMASHKQIQQTKVGSCFCREKGGIGRGCSKGKSIGESSSSGRQQLLFGWAAVFLIGWAVAGSGEKSSLHSRVVLLPVQDASVPLRLWWNCWCVIGWELPLQAFLTPI